MSDVVARAATAATQPRPAHTLVLEADVGETAVGAFMVENRLTAPVSAPVSATILGDAQGIELQFDPPAVTLGAGEQILVRVGVVINDALEPGVGYQAEVSVPGVTGTQIPVVVRRRETTSA